MEKKNTFRFHRKVNAKKSAVGHSIHFIQKTNLDPALPDCNLDRDVSRIQHLKERIQSGEFLQLRFPQFKFG
jgi:hypothetical protein